MKLLSIAIFILLLTSQSVSASDYTIKTVKQPGQNLLFQYLVASPSENGAHVHGRINARMPFGLPKGHVDIAAYAPNGELLAESTSYYSPSSLTYQTKRKGGVRFSTELAGNIPTNSIIKIAFHQDPKELEQRPAHIATTAK